MKAPPSRLPCARRAIHAAALAALALTAAAPPGRATPLDPRGIPEEAVLLAHLDLDAVRDSQAASAALALCELSVPEMATFKRMTGVNPLADITGITIGILLPIPEETGGTAETQARAGASAGIDVPAPRQPATTPAAPPGAPAGKAAPPRPAPLSAVAILRGRFKPDEIFNAAAAAGCPTRLVRGHTFMELSDKGHPDWRIHLAPLGPNALALLTDMAQAPALITAHRDGTRSRLLPPAFADFSANAAPGSAPLLCAFGETASPTPDGRRVLGGNLPIPADFFLLLADDGRRLRLRATGTYSSEAEATRSRTTILGAAALLRMVRGGGANAGPDTRKEESGKTPHTGAATPDSHFANLLEALDAEADGRTLRLTLDHPAQNLAAALQKAVARKRAQAK
ncbi:MAG: hypothetical protein LBG65_03630 [Puniceicoccales bacterium]|jgi:hypothetical protein|nr:hypothetical protein [Puniceicoccales bacterium]